MLDVLFSWLFECAIQIPGYATCRLFRRKVALDSGAAVAVGFGFWIVILVVVTLVRAT